jgi:hypothetical protein
MMYKTIAASLMTGVALIAPSMSTPASAGSLTNTSTSTNVLVNAKCYHHHGTSSSTFHWDSKKGKYVAYDSAHTSTTDYTKCHK